MARRSKVRGGHITVEADANETKDSTAGEGVRRANELLASGKPDAAALARLLLEFPTERDKILAAIHAQPAGGSELVTRVLAAKS